jgi:hypothetical protein
MLRRVVLVRTDISEELSASFNSVCQQEGFTNSVRDIHVHS